MKSSATNPPAEAAPAWPIAAAPVGAALLGPFLPLMIVYAGTLPPAAPHPNRVVVLVLAAASAAVVIVSLAALVARGAPRFPRSLWLPMGALVAAAMVAVGFAANPGTGAFAVLTLGMGFIVLVSSVEALAHVPTRRCFLACYFSSAIAAGLIACALSVMKLPPAMFAYEHGRASGTFLQPNELAGYMLWVIPLGFAQAAAPRWLRVLGLAGAAIAGVSLILSVSRAAIVSLMVALLILVRKFGGRAAIAYALVAACGLLLLATVFRDVAHDPSENASRLAVWAGSLRIAQRFALTGVGPFGFHLVYPRFRLPQYDVNEVHAHDLPLQILIEYGVLGLAAFAWFVIAAIRQGANVGRSIDQRDRERSMLFWALVCGFAASALQNAVDVVTTFLLVVAWPMLGLLLALGEPRRRAS